MVSRLHDRFVKNFYLIKNKKKVGMSAKGQSILNRI